MSGQSASGGPEYFLKRSYKIKDERFEKEVARAEAAHKNVLRDGLWKDSGEDEDGKLWMVLKAAPGISFKERWEATEDEETRCKDLEAVRDWLDEIQAELLCEVKFIHGDPNIGNVLVPPPGDPITPQNTYLIDYGKVFDEVNKSPFIPVDSGAEVRPRHFRNI